MASVSWAAHAVSVQHTCTHTRTYTHAHTHIHTHTRRRARSSARESITIVWSAEWDREWGGWRSGMVLWTAAFLSQFNGNRQLLFSHYFTETHVEELVDEGGAAGHKEVGDNRPVLLHYQLR
eukprot:1652566-Rhodomonas_salina.6